jgi:hypothetical protein
MPYAAEVSRSNPSCILFIIDQSSSMNQVINIPGVAELPFDDEGVSTAVRRRRSKAQGVADAINRLLQNLVIKCAKSEGIRDYYHIGVIGYGRTVGPRLGGRLAGCSLVPISQIADSPLRIDQRASLVNDESGKLVERTIRMPVWVEPVGNGPTPMCTALDLATTNLRHWISSHPECFPPIVIHITDGGSTDGSPLEPSHRLRSLCSTDSHVLLFNLHLSSKGGSAVQFPDVEVRLPDRHAHTLFQMSSILPRHMQDAAQQEGYGVSANARGFVYNAEMSAVIQFLDIGTRPSNLR